VCITTAGKELVLRAVVFQSFDTVLPLSKNLFFRDKRDIHKRAQCQTYVKPKARGQIFILDKSSPITLVNLPILYIFPRLSILAVSSLPSLEFKPDLLPTFLHQRHELGNRFKDNFELVIILLFQFSQLASQVFVGI